MLIQISPILEISPLLILRYLYYWKSMHLAEILAYRATPAAGLYLGITRRCPLSCAHCSTSSTMASEEMPDEVLIRFVESFRSDDRPEILAMSGGEALLRPALVQRLAERARQVGTRTSVLSGLFFARSAKIPLPVREAIRSVDHFSASIDAFHEREVPRANVFAVLDTLLAEGADVSLHIVGRDADDPYLEDLTEEVKGRFGRSVPMLVNSVGWFGRARGWLPAGAGGQAGPGPITEPCSAATWPVVGFDGTVVACANDDALDERPNHLVLGRIEVDDWGTIKRRCLSSAIVRGIRTFGPQYLAERYASGAQRCAGYCETCLKLSAEPAFADRLQQLMARPAIGAVEQEVRNLQEAAGPLYFAARHGVPRYAELAAL